MELYNFLVKSANEGLKMQNKNGSVPAGHNGPWSDPDTPVRNTSNWLKLFCFVYKKTNERKYLDALKKATNYLLSEKSRPYDKTFYCRTNRDKNKSNGLIGQAWVLEALIESYRILKKDKILKTMEKVYLLHNFDYKKNLWYEINIDGSIRKICGTYNQQLWFAVMGLELFKLSHNDMIKKRIDTFINNMNSHFKVYNNGIIKHKIEESNSPLKKLKSNINNLRKKDLSLGYHSFNLYGFALLKQNYPNLKLWKSKKFIKSLEFIETEKYKKDIKKNKYGFCYNVSGIEVAYVLSVFKKNSEKQQKYWLKKQFQRNYDFNKNLLCKNTYDPETLSARLYEASRLENLKIF